MMPFLEFGFVVGGAVSFRKLRQGFVLVLLHRIVVQFAALLPTKSARRRTHERAATQHWLSLSVLGRSGCPTCHPKIVRFLRQNDVNWSNFDW